MTALDSIDQASIQMSAVGGRIRDHGTFKTQTADRASRAARPTSTSSQRSFPGPTIAGAFVAATSSGSAATPSPPSPLGFRVLVITHADVIRRVAATHPVTTAPPMPMPASFAAAATIDEFSGGAETCAAIPAPPNLFPEALRSKSAHLSRSSGHKQLATEVTDSASIIASDASVNVPYGSHTWMRRVRSQQQQACDSPCLPMVADEEVCGADWANRPPDTAVCRPPPFMTVQFADVAPLGKSVKLIRFAH